MTIKPSPFIHTYSLLKLVAVLGIIGCHISIFHLFDACSRMVEILFLTSGFLMAYNHYEDTTTPTPWQTVKTRLPRFYPIHLICFCLQLFFVTTWAIKPLSYHLSVGILNLALQQAWFIGTQFSYNNVSWFLSALVFAYALTPLLKRTIQSLQATPQGLLKVFLSLALIRFYCEYLVEHASRYVSLDLHCNPFVQTLNYSMGYITGVAFLSKNNLNLTLKEKIPSWYITVLQFLIITCYTLFCSCFSGEARFYFIIAALPLLYILAFDRGLLHTISKNKIISYFGSITLEIFMLHSFILYKLPTTAENPISYVIFFGVTLTASVFCHELIRQLKRKLAKKTKH